MKHCKANHIWNGNLQSFVSDTRIILVLTWSNRISKYWNSSFVYMQVIKNNIYTTPAEQLQIPVGKSWKQRRDRYPYIHERSLAWFSRGLSITSDRDKLVVYPLNEMMQSCKCRTKCRVIILNFIHNILNVLDTEVVLRIMFVL